MRCVAQPSALPLAVAVSIVAVRSTLQAARTRATLARAAAEPADGAIARERGWANSLYVGTALACGALDAIFVGELESGQLGGSDEADEEEAELELHVGC